jgi:hypothetical protein
MREWIIRLTGALPSVVLGHVWVGLTLALGMSYRPRWHRLIASATWRPWVEKRWKSDAGHPFATTIGHGIVHPQNPSPTLIAHEEFHILQYEDLCFTGAIVGGVAACFDGPVGLGVWLSSGAPWLLPNFLTATIRNKRKGLSFERASYRLSSHEIAARAATKKHIDGRTWLQIDGERYA